MTAYSDLVLLDLPVAFWLIDAVSTLSDLSGHGHEAVPVIHTPSGCTPTVPLGVTSSPAGINGGAAVQFGGANAYGAWDPSFGCISGHGFAMGDYFSITDPATLPAPDGPQSMEAWLLQDDTGIWGVTGIYATGDHDPESYFGHSYPDWSGFSLSGAGDSDGYFPGVSRLFAGNPDSLSSTGDLTDIKGDGLWHHGVVSVGAGGRAVAFYLDGRPLCSFYSTNNFVLPNTYATLGRLLARDPWCGALAAVAVYDYPLALCQVQSHYVAATGQRPVPLRPAAQIQILD